MLRAEGYPEIAGLVESHVLMGLSKQEIESTPILLPHRDFMPTSIEGELFCYADRFHSKNPVFNNYDSFMERLEKRLPEQAAKFKLAAEDFGIPDLAPLAKKYNHPIE
jgi:uncharacterized protein